MKIYCSCCDKVQPVKIDDCRDAKTNEPFQDLVCAECDLVIASGTDIAQPEQEPVAHAIVAGALFDFMGWLTSRKKRIVLSGADDASPAAVAIHDFAEMRGLILHDPKVQEWQEHLAAPQPRQWQGLTDKEKAELDAEYGDDTLAHLDAIEAKLREKNA